MIAGTWSRPGGAPDPLPAALSAGKAGHRLSWLGGHVLAALSAGRKGH